MVENMFYGAPNHGSFVKLTPEIAAEIYKMALGFHRPHRFSSLFISKAVQAASVAWTAFYCASAGFRFAGSSPRFAAPVRASRPSPGGPPEGAGASLRFRKKDSAKSQNNFAQTSHGRRHRRPPRFAPVSPFCKK